MSIEINIRKAMVNDAEQIIEHIKRILKENHSFMATTPEEFTVSVVEQREKIVNCSERGLMLVAEQENQIIGILDFHLSSRKRFSHQGLFGISIQETFANKEIGTCLIKKLLEWARKQEHIEKISLEVFSNNERAIHLYTKLGFKEEGRRHKHVKFGPNEYVDDIIMSQFVK